MEESKRVKNNARRRLSRYVKKGLITKPEYCELCHTFSKYLEGHHDDYNKPLKVLWLCPACHKKIHSNGVENIIQPIDNKKYSRMLEKDFPKTKKIQPLDKIKMMLQLQGLNLWHWCKINNFHHGNTRSVISGKLKGEYGAAADIKIAVDDEFPGWNDPSRPLVFPKMTCQKCGNRWYPRSSDPTHCPACRKKAWHLSHTRVPLSASQ